MTDTEIAALLFLIRRSIKSSDEKNISLKEVDEFFAQAIDQIRENTRLKARCEELAALYVDTAALLLAEESTVKNKVASLKAKLLDAAKENARLRKKLAC